MGKIYYLSEKMRNELLETFEAALTMALEQEDETTADYYSLLIKHLKFILLEIVLKHVQMQLIKTGLYFLENGELQEFKLEYNILIIKY